MANEPHIQTSVFSSLYHFALLSSYSPFFSKNSCALLGIVTPQIIISCRFQICWEYVRRVGCGEAAVVGDSGNSLTVHYLRYS